MITNIDNYYRVEGSVSEANKTSTAGWRQVVMQYAYGDQLDIEFGGILLEKVNKE